MALHSPDKFKADNPAGHDGVFEWDYLTSAFKDATGRNIQPMDIDAHVEIGGHHLIFETKREGANVPGGQKQALLQLWAKGSHMVVFLWGKTDPMKAEIYFPYGKKRTIVSPHLTKKRLWDICFRWAKWANENPSPFQYFDRK